MSKDERYKAAKMIISDSSTERFSEIFTVIPKSVVANDLGKNTGRTYIFFDSPEDLMLKDVFRLAELIEVDKDIISDLIEKQYVEEKRKKIKQNK